MADPDKPAAAAGCVVCGSTDRHPFRRQDGYVIVRCAGCGLRFLDPQPTETELTALYGEDYFVSADSRGRGYDGYVTEAQNWRRTFRDRLTDLPATPGSLLDVGAATGFFVEQARAVGWDAIGIEPSEWAAAYARDKLGVEVHAGTLESMQFPDASFDVVTMWEVIEHLPDPRVTLAEVRRILRPGGMLVLSTPDAGSLAARLSGRRWLGWRKVPEHLFYFDRGTLDRLLSQSGFRPVGHRYASVTVSAGFAVERAMSLVGLPKHWRAPRWLTRRSVRVNPGYDLLVVARRLP
jgi:ubiquinone/menaquinone biosynthesis C-methylase UbiE